MDDRVGTGGRVAPAWPMVELAYPHPAPPDFGETIAVAPGVHWLRMPLPFRLDHVNIYLIEEADGWAVLDTGVDDAASRSLWDKLLAGFLGARPVTRVIVTHYHPDHVGAAAFLCARTGARLEMGETEYLTARLHLLAREADRLAGDAFYRGHGVTPDNLAALADRDRRYRRLVPDLPARYHPLRPGDRLILGGRHVEVHCCGGHAPAEILLHVPDDGLFFAADHVIAQISPNVSVSEDKPEDDPLGAYLASLKMLTTVIPADVMVLPGHRLPFRGLHGRMRQLADHHADRCAQILMACGGGARLSAADIVPILFPMALDPHQFWFAFSEALAHVNYLARRGQLAACPSDDGIRRWESRGE